MENESQELSIMLWDWNLIGSSEFLGMVSVPLKEVLDGISREQNYKLQPRYHMMRIELIFFRPGKKDEVKGEIRLRLHYISALVCIRLISLIIAASTKALHYSSTKI